MKKNLEIYEDNGGGIHLCILDGSECIAVFGDWQHVGEPGILIDACNQMRIDPDAYLSWDGDECGDDLAAADLYLEISEVDDLIAWIDEAGELQTEEWDKIGYAGRKALGLKEDIV